MMRLLLVLLLNGSTFLHFVVARPSAIANLTSVSAVARHGVRVSIPQAVTHRAVTSFSAFPLKFVPTLTEALPSPHATASLDAEPPRRDVSPATALSSLAPGLFHPLRC
jgi:hypothetical protein